MRRFEPAQALPLDSAVATLRVAASVAGLNYASKNGSTNLAPASLAAAHGQR